MPHTPRRPLPPRAFALAALFAAGVAATAPADVVILKDGFTIQGTVVKESESIVDPATNSKVLVAKPAGFDRIHDGVRVVTFSSHNKQLGEISKTVRVRPEYKSYKMPYTRRKAAQLMAMTGAEALPDFDAKWRRTIKVGVGGGLRDTIEQQVTYLDPYCCMIASTTHQWNQGFRTSEMEPAKVRKLLSMHPELAEPDGKPDPVKRLAIARFMKDVGWLYMAKEEVERLKKAVPGPLPKDAQEQLEKFEKEMDAATADLAVTEAEAALNAGRYEYAAEVLGAFPAKTADPKDVTRFTQTKARLETARDQHALARRLLRSLIDEVTGAAGAAPLLAAGGGPAVVTWKGKPADAGAAELSAAAEVVYGEIHPDSIDRVEFFVQLASQKSGANVGMQPKKPEELLAAAVTGWVMGKIGARIEPDRALRVWHARNMVLKYQRTGILNERTALVNNYRTAGEIGLDELVQVITHLPPVEPENLATRTGTLLKAGGMVPGGVYRRRSAPFGNFPAGFDYLVKLPPEYHHGRAYPVLIVLTYPGLPAEQLLGAVAKEADKHGYILVAPDWAGQGANGGWNWNGEDHEYVTTALRDVVRHFTVDNDRVFLVGGAAGADMAMDVGASHPDLFAGVLAVCPNPRVTGFFAEYWRNAQKLPMYVVTGELVPEIATKNLRWLYEKWMPAGFPALEVLYRGRGLEWYPAETPVMFDWMSRKRRANGTALLALAPNARPYPWQTAREGDNRFYWLSADQIDPRRIAGGGKNIFPANLFGDIKGNDIQLKSSGVRTIGVWLGRDMIDWSKPVTVLLNGSRPFNWKPRKVDQDVRVLLEDYWHRGDRRMLYLAKLEFQNAQ